MLKLRLDQVEEEFDYVVVDTPPMLGDELIMALVASKKVLKASFLRFLLFGPHQAHTYSHRMPKVIPK